jgi:hypothetical protein
MEFSIVRLIAKWSLVLLNGVVINWKGVVSKIMYIEGNYSTIFYSNV